jgi:hypothetical protein
VEEAYLPEWPATAGRGRQHAARTGLSTSVTDRQLKTLKRSVKDCREIEFQSKERSVLNRRLRYILSDEIHHRTQDAASVA